MIVRSLSLAFAASAALALPAAAASQAVAQLSSVAGDVRVTSSSGLAAAGKGTALKAGDRIVARSGAASIAYADGCVVAAPAGSMITIGAASPCAGAAGLITPGPSAAFSIPGISKWDTGAYFAAGGVVLLGASLIAGLTTKDDPESP